MTNPKQPNTSHGATAGSYGRSARPKSPGELVGAFLEQAGRRSLTAAQRRRVKKATNRSMRETRA